MTCHQLRKVKQPRKKQTYQTNRQFPKEPKITNKLIKTDHLTGNQGTTKFNSQYYRLNVTQQISRTYSC